MNLVKSKWQSWQRARHPELGEQLNVDKDIILYIEGLSVSFDGFKALNNLNLYINDGELRCLIGANGAGKTT
ncbi:MAG: hypothetical protein OIF38_13290, partial [Cellvibrionaceae bacterium]|nr:hypothetical protein [Cellvibrionaceae bacterium]